MPDVPVPVSVKEMIGMRVRLDPRRVRVDVENPRRGTNPPVSDADVQGAVRRISETGELESGAVHPLASPDSRYDAVLMSGEAERRACLELGLMFLAEVHSVAVGRRAYLEAMTEHVRTVPHTLLQRTAIVTKLVTDYSMSTNEIGQMFNVLPSSIDLCFDVFKLAPSVRELFAQQEREGVSVLGSSLVSALRGLSHIEQQKLAEHIVGKKLGRNQAIRYVNSYRDDARQEKVREVGLLERLTLLL